MNLPAWDNTKEYSDLIGADFKQKYIDILRDTGRMTAEDLVMKHLGEDITKPEFWLKSVKFVTDSIESFSR